MKRVCQGCGGVLGVDCFNEYDCIKISQNNERYYLRQEIMEEIQNEREYNKISNKLRRIFREIRNSYFIKTSNEYRIRKGICIDCGKEKAKHENRCDKCFIEQLPF